MSQNFELGDDLEVGNLASPRYRPWGMQGPNLVPIYRNGRWFSRVTGQEITVATVGLSGGVTYEGGSEHPYDDYSLPISY